MLLSHACAVGSELDGQLLRRRLSWEEHKRANQTSCSAKVSQDISNHCTASITRSSWNAYKVAADVIHLLPVPVLDVRALTEVALPEIGES